jgi:NADPH:quinone reductase-like Zn-dependent oxidoreductase
MKAFTIDRYKPSDGGRIADVTEPVPANDQVLVQIHAAGVNLLDSKIRSGEFKFILPYPDATHLGPRRRRRGCRRGAGSPAVQRR